ncbi:MAG: aspartyl/glutamyl-tRNA(Asn/Gln) amidotransferase subunit [Pseudomonadota bacterium]|jgi:aspartyl-tRNA(Asn)/glutamyl-tRNA(Gln) amidotransferase subunit B
MTWEVVIGIETHAQLATQSKIFSGAATAFGAEPNVQTSLIDLAMPGVLPVVNREAVGCAIRFGLAVGAKIDQHSIFARKNYFYPDLPKGYQISQFENPVVVGGQIVLQLGQGDDAVEKVVNLTRAHMEEDAGKSLHEDFHGRTGVDLNRAGTPLLEIVTEPEMRSSAEAVAYARALHSLVRWIGICDGNMQEGSFRCDANVSVRKPGQPFGTRREIKNLNSFRFMQQAIDFEVQWQINELEEGRAIQQATVQFDPDTGETRAMRTKEDAMDYRYFPDPDLLPVAISDEWIDRVRGEMPELPQAMRERFQTLGLSAYDAAAVTASLEIARYYEGTLKVAGNAQAKVAANWIMGELSARLNREGLDIEAAPVNPEQLGGLIARIADQTISNAIAKKVFDALWQGQGKSADEIIEAQGLKQITDTGAIEALVDEVIAANPGNVAEFKAGKEKALNALVGQIMKAAKGKANPQQVNDLLKKKLG